MMQPPPTAVTTIVAQRQEWPATLNVIGTMEAVQGVTVSADLPGAIERINFDSGKQVHQGDVLVELDTRQERAQLADVEAQSELARLNFERNRQLLNAGVISRLDYDRAVADQKQTEARVNEIHATIQRKTIRAPFSGVLGIRRSTWTVSISRRRRGSAPGAESHLRKLWRAPAIVRRGANRTRHPRRQRGLERSGVFRPRHCFGCGRGSDHSQCSGASHTRESAGQTAPRHVREREGHIGPKPLGDYTAISAVNYAPYGDSVYVVSDLKDPSGKPYRGVRQQFVKVESSQGDQVAITSGVNPGDEVVSSGVFKLRNGAAVSQQQVQPGNNPAPSLRTAK